MQPDKNQTNETNPAPEMKMPEEPFVDNGSGRKATNKNSMGAAIAVLVILLVILLGAVIFWFLQMDKTPAISPLEDGMAVEEAAMETEMEDETTIVTPQADTPEEDLDNLELEIEGFVTTDVEGGLGTIEEDLAESE